MSLPARDAYAWTGHVLAALRGALDAAGFVEMLPAILSSRFEPGARHSIAVLGDRALPTIRGPGHPEGEVAVTGARHYYLPVSHCVEKQLALEHAERLYCVAPCVRLLMEGEERTGRHLFTFFQVEIEWRTEDQDEVFTEIEALLADMSGLLLERMAGSPLLDASAATRIRSLGRGPFERLPFRTARDRVARVGGPANPHAAGDLTHPEEAALSNATDRPFWITDYPPGVRDSIYRRTPDGLFATYDLILPAGYGELATGGLRPASGAEIRDQARQLADRVHDAYAAWKDRTGVQTGGLGFGLERLIRYCAGVPDVLDLRFAHDQGPNASIRHEEPSWA